MLKQIVRINNKSDFTLTNSLPNGYDNENFIIQLFTTDPAAYFEAKYVDGTAYNCTIDTENNQVIIYVNNHGLNAGCVHIAQAFDYNNNHFADGIENLKMVEESNIYLVLQNGNATSAMFVGSSLPDLTGAADFITQSDLNAQLAYYVTEDEMIEYVYEHGGSGYIDLSAYVTKTELNNAGYVTESYLSGKNYATTSDLGRKQDKLISAVNIKTINGYSLLGNGNLEIAGGGTIDTSSYVTYDWLEAQSYVTNSYLISYEYITQEQLNSDLDNYVTEDQLGEYGFVTDQDLTAMGYATQAYVVDYVAAYAPEPDLSAYVTYDWLEAQSYVTEQALSTASYVTETALSNAGYVTEQALSTASYVTSPFFFEEQVSVGALIDNGDGTYSTVDLASKAWVETYYVSANNMGSYVTETELSNAGYVTETSLANMSYVTETALSNMAYVTETELSNAGYVTETSLANMSYVTETELSNKGYLTSIPSEYVTESELSAKSYATTSQLAGKQDTLVSGTNIKTINNNSLLGSGNVTISASGNLVTQVTQAEYNAMVQAGTLDPTALYIITDAPATDLSYYAELTYVETYYVAKTDLANAGYITGSDLSNAGYLTNADLANAGYITQAELSGNGYLTSIPSEYVTETELSGMGYATTSQLSSYVKKTELTNAAYAPKSYVNTYYVAKTAFIYDSTNHTLTINI